MLAPVSRLTRSVTKLGRSTMLTSVRNSGSHGHGGIPGENLPFDIHNRYKLTALMAVYFSTGLGLPYFILRHQLVKNQ